MKEEICAAVRFIAKLISRHGGVAEDKMEEFEKYLQQRLEERFQNHWHPERPWRGQAYRCMR